MEYYRRRNNHGFSPQTITIDTPLRKNSVIRKDDLAIVTEKKPIIEPVTTEQKPRLIHVVACKTVGEYKRNQAKIGMFCLEETKQQKAAGKNLPSENRKSNWTPDKVRKVATSNKDI